jgi:sigma-B regulation protein RsbU (phosphoserine phosphatase)
MSATIAEPATQAPPSGSEAPEALRCMEIWGGNQPFDSALSVPGVDAWVYSQPYAGHERGGDIHYVSTCGRGKLSRFAVADVAGHGREVGELAAQLRGLMRKHINKLDQTSFVQTLGRDLSAMSKAGTFATALLTTYYAPTGQLILCNAGHPRPLWYRVSTGTWRVIQHDIPDRVEQVPNLPLGIIPETNYYQFAVQLALGDLILIYTDSVTEARNPDGKMLEEAGLLKLVAGLDASRPELFTRSLLEALDAYRGHAPPDDDLTVVLLHHNAGGPIKPSVGEMMKMLGKMVGLVKV